MYFYVLCVCVLGGVPSDAQGLLMECFSKLNAGSAQGIKCSTGDETRASIIQSLKSNQVFNFFLTVVPTNLASSLCPLNINFLIYTILIFGSLRMSLECRRDMKPVDEIKWLYWTLTTNKIFLSWVPMCIVYILKISRLIHILNDIPSEMIILKIK